MFAIHHPRTLLNRTALVVRNTVGWVRFDRGRLRRDRIAVLTLYVVMNLGIPIGDFAPKAGAHQTAACHCSTESRAAGRCCCSNRPTATGKSGCCATKAKSESKSCCKTNPERSRVAAQKVADPEETLAWTGGCHCGPDDSPMMLICPQPRILADTTALELPLFCGGWVSSPACSPCGDRSRPCVPPPESPVV